MKWIRLQDKEPPKETKLWGYDVFYDKVHLCEWDGNHKRDDGMAFIDSLTESGDDYAIEFWMIAEIPLEPNCDFEPTPREG